MSPLSEFMSLGFESGGVGLDQRRLAVQPCPFTPVFQKTKLAFNRFSPNLNAPHPGQNNRNREHFMAVNANDLRRGQAINYNGDISVVLDVQHRTPGNLRAFVQATLRSIRTSKSSDVRFSSTEKVETVPMMTKKMEFSYKDGNDYVFTDPENYETVTLIPELVGDAKNYLVENGLVTITFVDEKAVIVEIPPSVILTVTDAPEGIRGDSANNVQKAVTIETGITVQAPLFIKTGEKIKIDTRTGKYMERA
jgi:elongation factor P